MPRCPYCRVHPQPSDFERPASAETTASGTLLAHSGHSDGQVTGAAGEHGGGARLPWGEGLCTEPVAVASGFGRW